MAFSFLCCADILIIIINSNLSVNNNHAFLLNEKQCDKNNESQVKYHQYALRHLNSNYRK